MPEAEKSAEELLNRTNEQAVERAFGAENRNKLIDQYFVSSRNSIEAAGAWQHVYRLLLWSDPTTGLAHCYESDKSQPGKPWYARSLAFHSWLADGFGVQPAVLAKEIDWLFVKACSDLAAAAVKREERLASAASRQRAPYAGRAFPEPGADPELAGIIQDVMRPYLSGAPSDAEWRVLTQKVRQFLAVQNKRKNLVGEGFEDVLAQVIRRACRLSNSSVQSRRLLYEIPGFNRARSGGKENKVDLAINQPSMRTIVTAKWSVRADREKQFASDYEEYCNAESEGKKFNYVFVTNEFDPARLMRACDALFRNNLMFDYIVHINTSAVMAAYNVPDNPSIDKTRERVFQHIREGRLISLENWLDLIVRQ
ncbi:hypothetical protein FV226_23225 [Methylobacterium sp. WL12]|uniref:hypothetical protein n=1 Tax=Methylobacterium sp. WL12 TaxID=2603890 RepID=UPI0011CAD5B5|nr:hypothetical protein [Methylobacterium sp. WL12]TXM66636.1 hypothetical protein FV226_23225 [Methylobacterium sp. WL12]